MDKDFNQILEYFPLLFLMIFLVNQRYLAKSEIVEAIKIITYKTTFISMSTFRIRTIKAQAIKIVVWH